MADRGPKFTSTRAGATEIIQLHFGSREPTPVPDPDAASPFALGARIDLDPNPAPRYHQIVGYGDTVRIGDIVAVALKRPGHPITAEERRGMLTYIGTCRPQLPPHDEFLWCELKCPDGPVQMGYGQMVLGSERLFTLIEPRPTWWWDPERGDPVRLARVTSGHKPQLRPLVGAEGVVCAQSRKHPDRVWVNFGGEPQEVSMRYLERAAAERTEEEGAGPIPAKP